MCGSWDILPPPRRPIHGDRHGWQYTICSTNCETLQIVYTSLPLGEGIVLDPFMGSGSTASAATAVGYCSIGIDRVPDYFEMRRAAVPALAEINAQMEQMAFTLA